jgi:hypothetical protein
MAHGDSRGEAAVVNSSARVSGRQSRLQPPIIYIAPAGVRLLYCRFFPTRESPRQAPEGSRPPPALRQWVSLIFVAAVSNRRSSILKEFRRSESAATSN